MTAITHAAVSVYTIPTDGPESDGTLEWTSTTIVIVDVMAGGTSGLGYTYGHKAVATIVSDLLLPIIRGRDAMDVTGTWGAMTRAIRNQGRPGIASMAIAAVDAALWDLKARILRVPLVTLLGAVRDAVPVYGSGGFTSYSIEQLQHQLADWVDRGITRVKMKVGRTPDQDDDRVQAARDAIEPDTELFVDANGAYDRKHALAHADAFADAGFLQAGALCDAYNMPLSSHTASALHVHPCCAIARVRHLEHFYDHERIERMLFDGAPAVIAGMRRPDVTRPGLGLEFKRADASRYAA